VTDAGSIAWLELMDWAPRRVRRHRSIERLVKGVGKLDLRGIDRLRLATLFRNAEGIASARNRYNDQPEVLRYLDALDRWIGEIARFTPSDVTPLRLLVEQVRARVASATPAVATSTLPDPESPISARRVRCLTAAAGPPPNTPGRATMRPTEMPAA